MVKINRFLLETCPNHDTCWDLASSPDGNIYIGACMEHTAGGIAELVQFNTKTRKIRNVANMAEIASEKFGDTHAPQGKIHLSICPMKDGIIYGSTHCTTPPIMDRMWDPWAMHTDPTKCFKGARFYRYDPKTEEVLDFGAVVPYEGVSAMVYDEKTDRFFAGTFPKAHVYSWDKRGRDIIDLGRASEHYILSFIKYSDSNIYFTDYYGRLHFIDPLKMKIKYSDFKLKHPVYNDGMRNWMAHCKLAEDGWIYAGMYSYNNLIRFRPKGSNFEVEDLGKGIEDTKDEILNFAFDNGAPVGIIYKDKIIYFVQLVYLGPKENVGSYITSFDTRNNKKEFIGILELDNFKPLVWEGVLGTDGNLYWADFDAVPPSLWSISL